MLIPQHWSSRTMASMVQNFQARAFEPNALDPKPHTHENIKPSESIMSPGADQQLDPKGTSARTRNTEALVGLAVPLKALPTETQVVSKQTWNLC